MINFSEQNKRKQLKSEGLKYDNKDSFSALKETCQKYYGIKKLFSPCKPVWANFPRKINVKKLFKKKLFKFCGHGICIFFFIVKSSTLSEIRT